MTGRQRKLTHVSHPVSMLAITQFTRHVPAAGPALMGLHVDRDEGESLGEHADGLELSVPCPHFNLYQKQSCLATGVAKDDLL